MMSPVRREELGSWTRRDLDCEKFYGLIPIISIFLFLGFLFGESKGWEEGDIREREENIPF